MSSGRRKLSGRDEPSRSPLRSRERIAEEGHRGSKADERKSPLEENQRSRSRGRDKSQTGSRERCPGEQKDRSRSSSRGREIRNNRETREPKCRERRSQRSADKDGRRENKENEREKRSRSQRNAKKSHERSHLPSQERLWSDSLERNRSGCRRDGDRRPYSHGKGGSGQNSLLRVFIYQILYVHGILPDECFECVNYAGYELNMLRSRDDEVRELIRAMDRVDDAVLTSKLDTFVLEVRSGVHDIPVERVEVRITKASSDGEEMDISIGSVYVTISSSDAIDKLLSKLVSSLKQFASVPDPCETISIVLTIKHLGDDVPDATFTCNCPQIRTVSALVDSCKELDIKLEATLSKLKDERFKEELIKLRQRNNIHALVPPVSKRAALLVYLKELGRYEAVLPDSFNAMELVGRAVDKVNISTLPFTNKIHNTSGKIKLNLDPAFSYFSGDIGVINDTLCVLKDGGENLHWLGTLQVANHRCVFVAADGYTKSFYPRGIKEVADWTLKLQDTSTTQDINVILARKKMRLIEVSF